MYPLEKYNYVTYEQNNEDGSVSKVTLAMSTYSGKVVKGVAKCIETDDYSLEDGKRLAAARCDYKVCLKRKKRAGKKLAKAREELHRVEDYYNKMKHYYFDASEECLQSSIRLEKLENSFK